MDKKIIIVIIIAAVLVVAGVYLAFGQGDKKLGGEEVYSDIKVGDTTDVYMDMTLVSDVTEDLTLTDVLEQMYFVEVGIEPSGTTTVTFNGVAYECDVYKMDLEELGTFEYNVIHSSGVILEEIYDNGYMKLMSTTCDVTKTILEQELTVGTTFTYELKAAIPGVTSMFVKGEMIHTITEIGNGEDCKMNSKMNVKEKMTDSVTLESIEGDVYKFVGDDEEYTKDGAMSYYAYTCCLNDLKDLYGEDAITMGERSSKKISTAYGDRDVTAQKVKVETFGFSADVTFYYGAHDVLYKTEVSAVMEGIGDLTLTADLRDSDAVKSL